MPVDPKDRDYKREAKLKKLRPGAHEAEMERQRARRALDKKGVDRTGKDVAHVKALARGGSNADGVKLASPKKNRTYARLASGKPKNKYDT